MRVDGALLAMSKRLALFGKLEALVRAAEDGVAELSWLQRNIMNRSAGLHAREVASIINALQQSLNGESEWDGLRYLMSLSQNGERVHVRAIRELPALTNDRSFNYK